MNSADSKKCNFLTVRWNDLLGILAMICAMHRRNRFNAGSKNGEAMSKERLTALWLKPMAVEFATVKEVVAYPPYIYEQFFCSRFSLGFGNFPLDSPANNDLFLWRDIEIEVDGFLKGGCVWIGHYGFDGQSETSPVCLCLPIAVVEARSLQRVFRPRKDMEQIAG